MTDAWVRELGLALVPGVRAVRFDSQAGRLVLEDSWQGPITFSPITAGEAGLVERLLGQGARWLDLVAGADGGVDGQQDRDLRRICVALSRGQLLRWFFGAPDDPAAMLESRSSQYCPLPLPVGDEMAAAALEPSVYLRQQAGQTILHSALLHASITLLPAGRDLRPTILEEGGVPPGRARDFRSFLYAAGFLDRPDWQDVPWEFHDLMFHDASRLSGPVGVAGKGDRFEGRLPKPPQHKPPMAGRVITLPDPAGIPSYSLAHLLEARRSQRSPQAEPLRLEQLSALLWRAARRQPAPAHVQGAAWWRPIPGGGGVQELEFYLAVHRCDGLEAGFYHYDGFAHALVHLPDRPAALRDLLNLSTASMSFADSVGTPDCVLVIASRMSRLAREYHGIAYRLSLLHAGLALQTFYLVATDLGLSGCANGTGRSDLFAVLTGLDPLEETSIGEFALNGGVGDAKAAPRKPH